MYAVVLEVDVTGVDPEAGNAMLRERMVPAISARPGFQSGTWLPGDSEGRGLSLTLWDSEEHARAMADSVVGPESNPMARAKVLRCEVLDVVATA